MSPTRPLLLLLVLGLVGLFASPAAAADWTAAPAANQFGGDRESFRYTLNPGAEIEDGVVIANSGSASLTLPLSTGGLKWVQLNQDDVVVAPGESVTVPFSVVLPAEAAAGDYVGAIAGVPIRLRVGGTLKPSLDVEDLRVDGDTVTYTIHNTGNAILGARQTVTVTGPFGRWAAKTGRVPDVPELAPGRKRTVSVTVDDVTRAFRLTANVTLLPLLTDAAGSTAPLAPVKASGHAWAIPWTLPLAVIVLLAVAFAVVRRRRRPRFVIAR